MDSLVERLKKARQRDVNVNGFAFIIARPTDLQINELEDYRQSTILENFVVGWVGVKESDLVDGGLDELVAFSSELFMEWVADKPEFWSELTGAISQDYNDRKAALESAEKKHQTG